MRTDWHSYTDSNGFRVEGDADFVNAYRRGVEEYESKQAKWIEWLRAYGVKASHPNDGWNNRERCYFSLSYPGFNDGIEVGDMVALGDHEQFVVVTVTKIDGLLMPHYHYRSYK